MKVVLKIDWVEYVLELSGSDLETVNRVLSRGRYLHESFKDGNGAETVAIDPARPLALKFTVLPDSTTIVNKGE